ncbi:RPOLA_N domain-containing protein, partial [Trichonephila clavata]
MDYFESDALVTTRKFIALKVHSPGWEYDCFGIPLEVVQAMNADFDGDECNLYLVPNALSQAECATILNPESQLGCFVMQ